MQPERRLIRPAWAALTAPLVQAFSLVTPSLSSTGTWTSAGASCPWYPKSSPKAPQPGWDIKRIKVCNDNTNLCFLVEFWRDSTNPPHLPLWTPTCWAGRPQRFYRVVSP